MVRGRRLLIALLVTVAAGAAVVGAVLGAREHDSQTPGAATERRAGGSFLAKIVPRPARRKRKEAPRRSRAAPWSWPGRSPLERKVAQLFLVGFEGTDLNAEVFRRLRRLDLGGILISASNYTSSDLLGQLAGEARVIASDEGHVRPFVMAAQPGGELNSFPDLPPARPPPISRRRATPAPRPPTPPARSRSSA